METNDVHNQPELPPKKKSYRTTTNAQVDEPYDNPKIKNKPVSV